MHVCPYDYVDAFIFEINNNHNHSFHRSHKYNPEHIFYGYFRHLTFVVRRYSQHFNRSVNINTGHIIVVHIFHFIFLFTIYKLVKNTSFLSSH